MIFTNPMHTQGLVKSVYTRGQEGTLGAILVLYYLMTEILQYAKNHNFGCIILPCCRKSHFFVCVTGETHRNL